MTGQAVLFDTNAYSRLMQGDQCAIRVANEAPRLLLCSVVMGELESGFRSGSKYEKNREDLSDFCSDSKVETVFSTGDTVKNYGELMASLRKAGTKIPTNDVWIGAFAKEHKAMVFSYDHHMEMMVPFGVCWSKPNERSTESICDKR